MFSLHMSTSDWEQQQSKTHRVFIYRHNWQRKEGNPHQNQQKWLKPLISLHVLSTPLPSLRPTVHPSETLGCVLHHSLCGTNVVLLLLFLQSVPYQLELGSNTQWRTSDELDWSLCQRPWRRWTLPQKRWGDTDTVMCSGFVSYGGLNLTQE